MSYYPRSSRNLFRIDRMILILTIAGIGAIGVPVVQVEAQERRTIIPIVEPIPLEVQLREIFYAVMETIPFDRLLVYQEAIDRLAQSGIPDGALGVGDRSPSFTLETAAGEKIRLNELRESGPVVLTWYRGGWCPYCNLTLRVWDEYLTRTRALGATLVAITPEQPDSIQVTTERDSVSFQILWDRGNELARQFGIAYELDDDVLRLMHEGGLDLKGYNRGEGRELPLPATYVIDSDGVIRHAFVSADYRKRAEPADVIRVLESLAGH